MEENILAKEDDEEILTDPEIKYIGNWERRKLKIPTITNQNLNSQGPMEFSFIFYLLEPWKIIAN